MRGAACRDKRNTGVKNPWKELPVERKEEEGIYCVATAASASVSEGREIHLVDYDRRILVSIPCAPVSTKLREWFSSFTGIPSSITRPRWKRPLSKSGLLEATNCSFFSNDRRRRSPGAGTILFDRSRFQKPLGNG